MLAAFAIVVASCSGNGEPAQVASLDSERGASSEDTNAEPLADTEEAMLAFTQCLRDQGMDVGDPTIGADGSLQLPPIEFTFEGDASETEEPDFSEFEKMIAPCEELLGGLGGVAPSGGDAAFEDALVEYTQCMRDNGVDMPDPDFSDGIIDLGVLEGDDFDAADAVCRSLFESFLVGG